MSEQDNTFILISLEEERELKRKWTREKIIKELQSLYSQGFDVSDSSLSKHYKKLYSAMLKEFGKEAHRKAILEAKLPYHLIRKVSEYADFTNSFIAQSLQVLHKLGVDISQTNLRENYRGLYNAIQRNYKDKGGYKVAYKKAGFEYSQVSKRK